MQQNMMFPVHQAGVIVKTKTKDWEIPEMVFVTRTPKMAVVFLC